MIEPLEYLLIEHSKNLKSTTKCVYSIITIGDASWEKVLSGKSITSEGSLIVLPKGNNIFRAKEII